MSVASAASPKNQPPQGLDGIADVAGELWRSFHSGRTRSAQWRIDHLKQLRALVQHEEGALLEALRLDLGKSNFEGYGSELALVTAEIDFALKHLKSWMGPERPRTPMALLPGRLRVHREPKGPALIIAPWNYPVQLTLSPLVGALAAGNPAVLKPSEVSSHTAAAIARLVPRYFPADVVSVVTGAVEETTALLKQRWGHIFYTGNGFVGRIVMRAAAEHLTPVTLELGGKCPAIVAPDASIDLAAKRIVWGKFFNAGQTCVAPDYVLLPAGQERAFIDAARAHIRAFYGANPQDSPDYGRIINDRHVDRLEGLMHETGDVALGGEDARDERYIAPTLIRGAAAGSRLLTDEIFGPLLPVVEVASVHAALQHIAALPAPLAVYAFSGSAETKRDIARGTQSGSVVYNDTISQVGTPTAPFGGVGESGQGSYHGRDSFDAFSHPRTHYDRAIWPDVPLRYPPYRGKLRWLKRLMG